MHREFTSSFFEFVLKTDAEISRSDKCMISGIERYFSQYFRIYENYSSIVLYLYSLNKSLDGYCINSKQITKEIKIIHEIKHNRKKC